MKTIEDLRKRLNPLKKKAPIGLIAERCNVTRQSVGHVVNGRWDKVSQELCIKVIQEAKNVIRELEEELRQEKEAEVSEILDIISAPV